ncbi:MAG TPA: FAD-dependent oxidoreductase, partial [Actinomycetota bacterium]|nr:FAD-dependent oxidoreductase [Actinomycetota bacterium]
MSASDLSRRRFLQVAALAAGAAALPRGARARSLLPALPALSYNDGSNAVPPGVAGKVERVIVIGAGFAGLAAANALTTAGVPCVVLEGRGRIGGRAHTVDVGGSPVDV